MIVHYKNFHFIITTVIKLTKLFWDQQDNLVVLSHVVLAVVTKTQVEEAKVKSPAFRDPIFRRKCAHDRRHIPVVASVTDHVQHKARTENAK